MLDDALSLSCKPTDTAEPSYERLLPSELTYCPEYSAYSILPPIKNPGHSFTAFAIRLLPALSSFSDEYALRRAMLFTVFLLGRYAYGIPSTFNFLQASSYISLKSALPSLPTTAILPSSYTRTVLRVSWLNLTELILPPTILSDSAELLYIKTSFFISTY